MSGGLFFFFWGAAPVAPPPPAPPAPIAAGAGASTKQAPGKSRKVPIHGKTIAYEPLTREHWDVREAYLRSLFPPEIPQAPPPDTTAAEYERRANAAYEARKAQLEQLNADRAAAVEALRAADSIETLKQQGAKISEINDKITELSGKQAVSRFMH